jgi:hypothetical protein
MYKNLNLNPKKKKVSDCVIRSFALASGKTWEETLTSLYEIAIQQKTIPNEKETYTKYAEILNFKKCKIELINGHKPTVKSFSELHPKGIYILRCAGHIVAVKNGNYIDTWDSGYKSVYMYWQCK